MSSDRTIHEEVAKRLRQCREASKKTTAEVEKELRLGPGWLDRFEAADPLPALDLLLVLLRLLGCPPDEFFAELGLAESALELDRYFHAEEVGDDLLLHFPYGAHDASYRLHGASLDQLDDVLAVLRDGLARLQTADESVQATIKSDAIAATFLKAVEIWPDANPSDLWYFLVYRAYCDPFNHPAAHARLDLSQSWKRAGGWALERVAVAHYGPFLAEYGVHLSILPKDEIAELLQVLGLSDRLEPDKVDVVLTGDANDERSFFGVLHVKSSFAERRTDDVPMSAALVEAGFTSPLWTMDCKATPSAMPVNRGELGVALAEDIDRRSAKRKDIEKHGYFSACFSYNRATVPTPAAQDAVARVFRCDFSNPDDEFSRFIIKAWDRFKDETG